MRDIFANTISSTAKSYRSPVTDMNAVMLKLTGRAIDLGIASPELIREFAEMLEYDAEAHAAAKATA